MRFFVKILHIVDLPHPLGPFSKTNEPSFILNEMDLNIWSISSYSLNNNKIRKCPEDVLWTYRGECWGWASWSDRC